MNNNDNKQSFSTDKINTYIASKPFWKEKYFFYLVLAIAVAIIILILGYSSLQNFYKSQKQKASSDLSSLEGLNQQLEGKIKSYRNDFLEKKVTLESDGNKLTFNIHPSTIIYKCSDFADIKTCTHTDKGIQNSQAQVLAKGDIVLFILYK